MEKRRCKVRKMGWLLLMGALLLALTACGSQEKKKYKVVTTIFPIYDWTRQIIGEDGDTDLILLQDSGVDLHSYQPTAADMANIASCDLFIYVGGESDEWVEGALKNQTNDLRKVLNLMEVLGEWTLEEEHKEGMQEEDHDHDEEDHDQSEKDEHIWLSLKNAALCCAAIGDVVKLMDPERGAAVDKNCAAYTDKLLALQGEYEAAAATALTKTLLFGDRFPFLYLVKDLGLDYYAAFSGCSAETEASFDTVIFLAKKLDELGLKAILQTEQGDEKLAKTIVETSEKKDRKLLRLDSLQSVTKERISQGASYLGIMEENLQVLKEALK